MLEVLVKAGYSGDPRVERAFDWLLDMRQDDGGWASPQRTRGYGWKEAVALSEPLRPDRSKPSSHLFTGMVLRGFAAHPQRRRSEEARRAGSLLASRIFKPDAYIDRKAPSYWTKLSFPFWWTDVLSSLDTLSFLGFTAKDERVLEGIEWLASIQKPSGYFSAKLLAGAREPDIDDWIALAICRAIRRCYANGHADTIKH